MSTHPTTACPELDALIAERVFGFQSPYISPDGRCNSVIVPSRISHDHSGRIALVSYSLGTTLTDACGLVVEAMERKGFKFTFGGRFKDGNFVASFFDSASNNHHIYEPTPPLAICLAALSALENEKEKKP